MRLQWTVHALLRQKEWEVKRGITREEVEAVVRDPAQVVAGDMQIKIGQTRRGEGLLRVAFLETGEDRKIITLYWTSKVEKYWRPS